MSTKIYTIEELQGMSKKDVSDIALDLKLKLSYKNEESKRSRYTLAQLIDMILDTQEVEYVEVLPEKKEVSSMYGEVGKVEEVKSTQSYDLKSIMSKLKTIQSVEELREFKMEVSNYFERFIKSKNKRAKKLGSLEMNRITMLFKQYEMKLVK